MKPFHPIGVSLLCTIFLTIGMDRPLSAAALDFGWGAPIHIRQTSKGKNEQINLAWLIQVSNNTNQRLVPRLDIVAVTDTGRQYTPASSPGVNIPVPHEEVGNITGLASGVFPNATRRAVAVFQDIDPKASMIHFYVGGLVRPNSGSTRQVTYLRITYKRVLSGWKWTEISDLR